MEPVKLHFTELSSSARPHPLRLPPSVCARVFVADSTIKGAGQGLFAKTDADKDTVMAFYNGVRITHSEVGAGDDDTLSLLWSLHIESEVARQTVNVF